MSVDAALFVEVQQFLNQEAHLLDERRFDEWLALFADEVRYWMPVISTPATGRSPVAGATELAWFDDDRQSLALRVRRLLGEDAHAETPPSRTRRLIGTVLITGQDAGALEVTSNFIVYRSRRERDVDLFAGRRDDVLLRRNARLYVSSRKIVLDQDILASQNLSIFF